MCTKVNQTKWLTPLQNYRSDKNFLKTQINHCAIRGQPWLMHSLHSRCTINLPCEEGERGKLHHHWPQWLWQQIWDWLHRRRCPMWPLKPGYHRSIGHSSPPGQRRDGICSAVQLVSYLWREQRLRLTITNSHKRAGIQDRGLQYEPSTTNTSTTWASQMKHPIHTLQQSCWNRLRSCVSLFSITHSLCRCVWLSHSEGVL